MLPSIERLIRGEITEEAEKKAIETFGVNLENVLLTSPIKGSRVLGFDPAFRTGCKLAVLDENGNVLDLEVIYPNEPRNDIEGAKRLLLALIDKYKIDLIAIGNGTASRESTKFVADAIKGTKVLYTVVSEAGASVYSASKEAIKEFPDLTVEKRSAISIGRRLQDPLAELVKIDPKSIGVGEYQHDVNQKNLQEQLDFTVMKVVNEVGVNINTASSNILNYISGLTKPVINKIMKYKELHKFSSREELKDAGLTDKAYEQAIGFLRIPDGTNPLDKTRIHPESYDVANKLISKLDLNINDIGKQEFNDKVKTIDIKKYASEFNIDEYTLKDIVEELISPAKDIRENVNSPVLRDDVLDLKDLKIGMKLTGTVRNVTSFGAFVDIIDCYVIEVNKEKEKVSLSLLKDL